MAKAFTLDIRGFEKAIADLKELPDKIVEVVDEEMNVGTIEMATKAKQLAPKDEGTLTQNIGFDISKHLEKSVTVNTPYAAYMEFGTGLYAAEYVSTLPETWQEYARQFKGSTGGTFEEMLKALREWVRRKGIASGKDIDSAAYLIARSILKNGVKAHPFLFPAYEQEKPEMLQNIIKSLESLR